MTYIITEVAHGINDDAVGTTSVNLGTRSGTEQWIIGVVGSKASGNSNKWTLSDVDGNSPTLIVNENQVNNSEGFAFYRLSAAMTGTITVTHAPTTNVYGLGLVFWVIGEDLDETDTTNIWSNNEGVLDWSDSTYTAATNDGVVVVTMGDDVNDPITIAGWAQNGDSPVDISSSYNTSMNWGDQDELSSGSHTIDVDLGTGSSYGIAAALFIAAAAGATPATLNAGSYTFTGRNLTATRALSAALNAGSFAHTGRDLTATLATAATLDAGSFTFTGRDLTGTRALTGALDAGGFTHTGRDLTAAQTFVATLDAGSFTFTGRDLTATLGGTFATLDAGAFTFTGRDLTSTRALAANLNAKAFAFTGRDITTNVVDLASAAPGGWYGFEVEKRKDRKKKRPIPALPEPEAPKTDWVDVREKIEAIVVAEDDQRRIKRARRQLEKVEKALRAIEQDEDDAVIALLVA